MKADGKIIERGREHADEDAKCMDWGSDDE
jgi:hypothetical protein